MKIEFLLKSISSILKKNQKFFAENPEIFLAVKERFEKAAYDDEDEDSGGYGDIWGAMRDSELGIDPQDEEDLDDQDEDYDYASGAKDEDQQDEDGEQDGEQDDYRTETSGDEEDAAQERLLAELKAKKDKQPAAQQPAAQQPAAQQPAAQQPATKDDAAPASGQWQPKSQYAPHHAKAMKEFMDQGFSARESERMANAHDTLPFSQAIKSKIAPSHPSEKMLNMMKEIAGDWHAKITHKIGLSANPEENPELHFNANKNQTVNNVFDAMNNATDAYRKSISHVSDPKQLTNMLTDFQHNWLQNNQHFFNDLHNAANKVSSTATSNKQARENRRTEGQMAIIGATRSGEQAPSAVGDLSNIQGSVASKEAAKQSVGGFKTDEEGPTQVSTVQDPAYTLATANPEYVKQQTIKFGEKHFDKMTPEQQQRFKEIKSKKTPTGNE